MFATETETDNLSDAALSMAKSINNAASAQNRPLKPLIFLSRFL
jgi:hypothetical protein